MFQQFQNKPSDLVQILKPYNHIDIKQQQISKKHALTCVFCYVEVVNQILKIVKS